MSQGDPELEKNNKNEGDGNFHSEQPVSMR